MLFKGKPHKALVPYLNTNHPPPPQHTHTSILIVNNPSLQRLPLQSILPQPFPQQRLIKENQVLKA